MDHHDTLFALEPLIPTPTGLSLATANYSSLTPAMGVGIATSVGKPRTWTDRPTLNAVAPYGIFNHKPAYDRVTFERLYLARLEAKQEDIDRALAGLTAANPEQRLVILCWCKLGSGPDGWCHRRMFAGWAADRYAIDVPDLSR